MEIRRKTPVDTGYAWIILFAVYITLALAGITYCNGVFNVIFLKEFDQSKAVTAWCLALQPSVLNLSGILASVMNERIGTRLTIIIGGAFVSTSFLVCSFASNFIQVFICYGLLAGLGFGLVYTPAIIILGSYFCRYRNLAYGIVTTGIGAGTMVFAPLIDYLVEIFTWKGAMLIIAGIFMNFFVTGALMRPPCILDDNKHDNLDPQEQETVTLASKGLAESSKYDGKSYDLIQKHNHISKLDKQASSLVDMHLTKNLLRSTVSLHSNRHLKRSLRNLFDVPNNSLSHTSLRSSKQRLTSFDTIQKPTLHIGKELLDSECRIGAKHVNEKGSDTNEEDSHRSSKRWYSKPSYLAFLLGLLFDGVGISCLYVHFPAHVMAQGTGLERSSKLISVMGFGSIIGRLAVGAITNKWKGLVEAAYIASCTLAGFTAVIGPVLCHSFFGQIVFCFWFALLANGFMALMAPMCIHLVGLHNLNLAYGMAIVTSGVGFLIGPPFAGFLYDMTSSYIYTFCLSGICYLFGGLLLVLLKVLTRCIKND